MLLLDLDHFKTVNDTWGHPVGDDVLKMTAKLIQRRIRITDTLFRFGGEVFIILMPQTNKKGAFEAAEKIRRSIEKEAHPVAGIRTVSIGIAQRIIDESFGHWYRRVDEALYQAKEEGRNCVIASDENKNLSMDSVRIIWQPEWSSSNSMIDEQHEELVDIANKMLSMSNFKNSDQEILQQIERLLNHILDHFEFEEALISE